ncbi:uncharacterized protein L201_000694 [Kwoniella dendrophila CBS 6074]|uniref:Uncharacterized protein n=1 Tax=Kwoniella dendrophila CBS 6074 TaxID=1295534 RepID=A0AAX4JM08_9TREE
MHHLIVLSLSPVGKNGLSTYDIQLTLDSGDDRPPMQHSNLPQRFKDTAGTMTAIKSGYVDDQGQFVDCGHTFDIESIVAQHRYKTGKLEEALREWEESYPEDFLNSRIRDLFATDFAENIALPSNYVAKESSSTDEIVTSSSNSSPLTDLYPKVWSMPGIGIPFVYTELSWEPQTLEGNEDVEDYAVPDHIMKSIEGMVQEASLQPQTLRSDVEDYMYDVPEHIKRGIESIILEK